MTANYAEAFKSKLMSLLDFLETRFPEDDAVATAKSAFATVDRLVGTTGARYIMRTFMETAMTYMAEIDNRNADFFIRLAEADASFAGMNITTKWSALSDRDKDRVWEYLDDLLTLGAQGLRMAL